MATLTDRYVQTLVKYNDALTAQRQKDVQKQYNEWERRQRALQTPAVQAPVQQEIPVLKPFANDEAAQKAERAQQINNDFADISNYINNAKAQKRQAAERQAQIEEQQRQAERKAATQKVIADKQAEKQRNSQVVMDENGMADVDSVKRNARATTAQRQSDWAQKQLAKGKYPQAQYTADGKLDVAALQNNPRIQEMARVQNQEPTVSKATNNLTEKAQKWLEPSYKMTSADRESYKRLFDEWKKENPAAYNAYFAFQTDGEGLEDAIKNYPEIRTILDVQNKLDPIASFMNGARNAFSGAQNLGGMAVKAVGNDDVDRWVDERLERRNREIANAQTQHPIATTGGNVAGMAAQYAMANAALGALSGGRLATQSVAEAYNANKNLGDAAKVFGANIGKQMIPDLLIDTSSNVINNVSNGADAGTVARDAAGNVLENLAWNALFELPGLGKATYQGIKDLRGLDNEIASLRNVERANIPALGDVTKAVENTPARQIAEDVQQATKEADDLAKVADDVRAVEEAPVRQAVDETANETAEQAARNIAEEINESKVSALGRNPVTGELSNYGNAIMRRLNELNGLSEARTAALNADPALKEAFGNAWTKYQTEFAKADAGQVNALKAATNELADVYESIGKVTGENANARRNLEDVYDILMHRNIPRKFEGDMPENINPILDMLDEQSRSNVENSLDTVRNYIDDTVYKNMRAIRGNETLQAKVKDVTDAYDKWIDAVYSGIGDTERLGKDVRNAMGRAERAFAKEGISAFHVPEKMAKQTNLPDMILKNNTPEGYVPPVDRTKYGRDDFIRELAGEDSYALRPEYKQNIEKVGDLLKREEELGRKISELRNEMEKEIRVDPELGREYSWMFDDNYTKRGLELKDDIEKLEGERRELTAAREEIETSIRNLDAENRALQASSFGNEMPSRATKASYEGFSIDTTGNRNIDKLIAEGKAYVAEMSPEEYLRRSSQQIYDKGSLESAIRGTSDANIQKYAAEMRNGAEYDMPYLDLARGEQEGRHRALAALVNQYDSIPVAVIPKSADDIPQASKIVSNEAEKAQKAVAERIEPEAEMTIKPDNIKPKAETPVKMQSADGGEVRERSYAKNIREGRVEADEKVRADFEENPREYVVKTNASTREEVREIVKKGLEHSQEEFSKMRGMNDPRYAPLGQEIARMLAENGNYNQAADVLEEVSEALTRAGQFTQSAYITMLKEDPMTALSSVQKQIKKINTDGKGKFGKKWQDFELTEDEIKSITDLKPGDEEGLKEAIDTISARLGAEYPSTMLDKVMEARKIAMLLNPRTLIRNPLANVPTKEMRKISDRIAALGERGYKALINKDYKVTQSLTGPGAKDKELATKVFNSKQVQDLVNGTPGKYEIPEVGKNIIQHKTMYKGTAFDRFLENAGLDIQDINKKLFKKDNVHSLAETTRNLTYKLLDVGDTPFVKKNFIDRLGSYIKAQGIKNIEDIPQEAIDIAWAEAMKATYKDNSWAVRMISGMRNSMMQMGKPGKVLANAVIPFVQAPGNIAARMVDYSVLGGANGIKNIIKGTKNADEALVREGIDQLSKGITGTGLVVAGVALHNAGIITGAYSKDKDQRNFQKQSGYREYALHIGDKYYNYDWAQPAAQPLIIGTLLAEAINNSDQYDSDMLRYFGVENSLAGKVIGGVKEGASASVNSWFNESPMQGLAQLLRNKAGGYESDIAGNIWDVAVSDLASSFIPSAVNAFAKSSDNTQRQTKDNDNAFATFVNEQKAKIPGLTDDLPAKYDTWGREMKYGETKAEAAFNRFINPGDVGTNKHDPLDDEINKLFDATQNVSVFPTTAPTSANGHKLTAKEYAEYQKDMGQRSHEMVSALIKSDVYKNMSNDEKVKTLSGIYSASKALTENKLYEKDIDDSVAKAYKEGGAGGVVRYYESKTALTKYGISDGSKAGAAIKESQNPEKTAKDLDETTKLMKQAGILDRSETQPPAGVVDIYNESGMNGVKDYVTVEQNTKGGSYSGYQKMKQTIPTLTAKEYADIYNQYSVPTKNGNYDDQFAMDTELIPYLTSRAWDNDEQLNIVAHALAPRVEGTWYIRNNRLYYNKPSVEKWQGK